MYSFSFKNTLNQQNIYINKSTWMKQIFFIQLIRKCIAYHHKYYICYTILTGISTNGTIYAVKILLFWHEFISYCICGAFNINAPWCFELIITVFFHDYFLRFFVVVAQNVLRDHYSFILYTYMHKMQCMQRSSVSFYFSSNK